MTNAHISPSHLARREPHHGGRWGFIVVVAVLVALGLTPAGGLARRAAAATPQVSVSPSSNLTTQVVTVSWQGYQPSQKVDIMQCKAGAQNLYVDVTNPNDQLDCYWVLIRFGSSLIGGNAIQQVVSDATGSGSTQFEVRDAVDLPALGCDSHHPCEIYVVPDDFALEGSPPNSTLPVASQYVSNQLTFAPLAGECSAGLTNVHLDGASSTFLAANPWSNHLCTANPPVGLDYINQDSPQGRENFLQGLADVGVTGSPFTANELSGTPNHPPFVYAPVDVNPVVIVYNMWYKGKRYNNLQLTPRLVAWLLANPGFQSGDIGNPSAFFMDPEFRFLNPTFKWIQYDQGTDQFIDVEVRAERTTDTLMLTDWLTHDPKAVNVLAGKDPTAPISTYFPNNFPIDFLSGNNGSYWPLTGVHTMEVEQLEGLVRCGGDQQPGTSCSQGHLGNQSAFPNQGATPTALIGVMDLASARLWNLPVAGIVNAAGHAVVPGQQNVQAALSVMTTNPDGVTQWPNFTTSNPLAYPLTRVDYAVLPTGPIGASTGVAIRQFVDYAVTDGQAASVLPPGYTPLTASQVAQAQQAAAQVPITGIPSAPSPPTTLAGLTSGIGATGLSPDGSPGPTNSTSVPTTSTTARARPERRLALPAGVNERQPSLADSAVRYLLPFILLAGLLACAGGPVLATVGRRRSGHAAVHSEGSP